MPGKDKCRILKDIRRKIADENDIPFVTRECTYQGDCSGTCPRCESELRYLEKQLAQRAALGKRITVAALCAGIAVAGAGCSSTSIPLPIQSDDLSGAVPTTEMDNYQDDTSETENAACTAASAYAAEDIDEGSTLSSSYSNESTTGASSDPADEIVELSGEVPY